MLENAIAQRRVATKATVLPARVIAAGSRGVILSEALRLFAERGYGSASVRDIAKLVGIQAASLYSHFPSKAHVLAELLQLGHEEHLRRMRDALQAARPDPQSQLVALVHAHVCAHAEFAMLAMVSSTELHALPAEFAPPILAVRSQSEMLLLNIIQRGVNLGVFRVPDVQLAMTAIGAMGLRVAHWYAPDNDKTPEQIAEVYAQFACRLLGIST